MEDVVDELNSGPVDPLEPLEPLEIIEIPEQTEKQVETSGTKQWNFRRWILPAGIVLLILAAIGIYFLVAPEPDKIIAHVLRFDIAHSPDTSRVLMSISNRQEKQAIILEMYPVFFGKDDSEMISKSIEGLTTRGVSLPLVLNPGEVRTLKISFLIEKKDLDRYAGRLKDSSHVVVFQNGPLPGQLEGFLGLGWRVVDADGSKYTNTQRLAYYVLIPSPPGFTDTTTLARSWTLSEDPFELCTIEGIIKELE
jgi:hypothetical protein